jgi:hypothetical protein
LNGEGNDVHNNNNNPFLLLMRRDSGLDDRGVILWAKNTRKVVILSQTNI